VTTAGSLAAHYVNTVDLGESTTVAGTTENHALR